MIDFLKFKWLKYAIFLHNVRNFKIVLTNDTYKPFKGIEHKKSGYCLLLSTESITHPLAPYFEFDSLKTLSQRVDAILVRIKIGLHKTIIKKYHFNIKTQIIVIYLIFYFKHY